MTNRTPREESNSVYSMKYGPVRRAAILKTLAMYDSIWSSGLPVNNKWQWSTKKDPDLKYLLKKGKLKQIRHATRPGRNQNTGLKHPGKGQTFLILA